MANCRSCGAEITWVSGTSGKLLPLNVKPDPKGNIWIDDDMTARYVRKSDDLPADRERFTSHFANCPDSKAWRKS